jgi:hypothetical protein
VNLIEFATSREVDDDDKVNDSDAYIKAVTENIEKLSALKDESSSYFLHRAFMINCNSKQKTAANNGNNKVSADKYRISFLIL